MAEFKVGDIVVLRSGGCPMTIVQLGKILQYSPETLPVAVEGASVCWLDEQSNMNECKVPLAALKKH